MKYVRNMWYNAAWCSYVEPDKPYAVTIMDEPIVLWRADGKIVAHEDRCCHRFAPMSKGRCEGASLRCMYHGFSFNAEGQCIEIPGQDKIPEKAKIKKYPLEERNGIAWIWMGEPENADAALIPETISPDSDEWVYSTSHLDFEAEGDLLIQNLLDFSHVSFVHQGAFNLGDDHAAELPSWDMVERGMQYTHWVRNQPAGMGAAHMAQSESVDFLIQYDFFMPGGLVLKAGTFPLGTADKYNGGRPDVADALHGFSASTQTVTPTTKGKARYHFGVGGHVDKGGEELKAGHYAAAEAAFAEDQEIIEAQQVIINQTNEDHPVLSAHDRANTLYVQMLKKIMRQYNEL